MVGGAVRDLLLHRVHNHPWLAVPDVDLVVEGSALEFVKRVQAVLPPQSIRSLREHGAYGTVELDVVLDGQEVFLDVASARQETYDEPGENPIVRPGSIEDDLARRDFSINAMALDLTDGELLDPYGGQEDLRERRLRLLHDSSLQDDPTRLVRGARYAARLSLELEQQSLNQVRRTLEAWPWRWNVGDPPGQAPPALGTRLRRELELLLHQEVWPKGLAVLQAWRGLQLLDQALQNDHTWLLRLRRAHRLQIPLMVALLTSSSDPLTLAERLQLPHRQHRLIAEWLALRDHLPDESSRLDVTDWCELLEHPGYSRDAVALALLAGKSNRRPLLRWLLRWRSVKAPISARQLINQGIPPGPELGKELRRLRTARLSMERP